MSNSLATTM